MRVDDLVRARRHLGRATPAFRPVIKRCGPCTLVPNADWFGVLARSIISQQISTKAAASIAGRVVAACGRGGLKATNLAKLDDEILRACGLSGNKLLSLRSLSDHFLNDRMLRGDLNLLSDREILDHLLPIRGIGVWTVEMFLIFALNRLDILPVGDLGLRIGIKELFEMEEVPAIPTIHQLAEPWRPYRSIATWYLWRMRDGEDVKL